ncbi:MAG: DUF4386 domain-containing protein [Holophagaceae bacterium]|nr:DUF4386 domain-containing protein [Holophagaceae bacterium]
MPSLQKSARTAGWLYLVLVILGLVNLIYIPSKLIVRGNAAATAQKILESEPLFRFSIASGVVSLVVFLFLALALYRLFKEIDQPLAMLMVILVLVQIPIGFVDEVNQLAVLVLLRGADFLSVFDQPHREALAMLFLKLSGQMTIVTEIFWGLWLFPLGWLVFRSGFLPRFLGVWLIINGVAYVATSFVGMLSPQHMEFVSKITFPALLGELAFMLWLVLRGARPKQPAEPSLA